MKLMKNNISGAKFDSFKSIENRVSNYRIYWSKVKSVKLQDECSTCIYRMRPNAFLDDMEYDEQNSLHKKFK